MGVSETQTYHTIVSFNETPTKQYQDKKEKKSQECKGILNWGPFNLNYFVTLFLFCN